MCKKHKECEYFFKYILHAGQIIQILSENTKAQRNE